jgi:hypothetical protein
LEQIHWQCGQRIGAGWIGGLVYLNVLNQCKGAVVLWKGTLVKADPPIFQPERNWLEPGRGKRIETYERDVWRAVGGAGEVVLEWSIDVGNGPIQDVVLRDC